MRINWLLVGISAASTFISGLITLMFIANVQSWLAGFMFPPIAIGLSWFLCDLATRKYVPSNIQFCSDEPIEPMKFNDGWPYSLTDSRNAMSLNNPCNTNDPSSFYYKDL
jgi:hypothetical protein